MRGNPRVAVYVYILRFSPSGLSGKDAIPGCQVARVSIIRNVSDSVVDRGIQICSVSPPVPRHPFLATMRHTRPP